MTRKYSDLFSANISPLHNHVKSLFMSWKCLPLSLIGRVNVIKMNVLPKFLYLFQCLPIFIPKSFFTILQRNISSFIWNKSKRINQSHLMKPKCLGGLALPNFQSYYWAANIRNLLYWVQQDLQLKECQWVRMEAASCIPATLTSLLSVPVSFKYTTLIKKKTVVKHSLRIWSQFRLALDLKDPCIQAPFFCNISFPPSLMDGAFNIWREHGLATVSQLYIANNFASFTQLREKFDLPSSHLFRYFQIRNFIGKQFSNFPFLPNKNILDEILDLYTSLKGAISKIYAIINTKQSPSMRPLKALWEEELNLRLEENTWDLILARIHSSSINSRHTLIQFKVVHRVHWSRTKLNKIFPDFDPTCLRCETEPATLLHSFWSCPKLSDFWRKIFRCFSVIFSLPLDPNPLTALFGILPESINLNTLQADSVALATLLARRLILMNWKSAAPPPYRQWVFDVLHALRMEKIRFAIKQKPKLFLKVWSPFLEYLKETTVS